MSNLFKIQYCSDLYLDCHDKYNVPKITPVCKYLALCGNIGNPFSKVYKEFLEKTSKKFEKVFLLAGVHEYYNNEINNTKRHISEICSKLENVYFLDDHLYNLAEIRIYGCTLWSDLDNTRDIEYTHIKNNNWKLRIHDILTYQRISIKNMQDLVQISDKPLLILTHYGMSKRCNEIVDCLDLDYLIQKPVVGLVHGHTLNPTNLYINDVPCVSNCFSAKKRKMKNYSKTALLEISLSR